MDNASIQRKTIKNIDDLGLHSAIERISEIKKSYSRNLVIYFVLSGECTFYVNGVSFSSRKEDLLLVNPNDSFTCFSRDGVTLAIVEFDILHLVEEEKAHRYFLFSKSTNVEKVHYNKVRTCLAKIIRNNTFHESFFVMASNVYELVSLLEAHFIDDMIAEKVEGHYSERMQSIVRYINGHYREGVSLKSLAEHEHLSPVYLSAFFKKNFCQGFYEYYNGIRLNYAMSDLFDDEKTIAEIATSNGFDDPRSFVRVFRDAFGLTPSEYRRSLGKKQKGINPNDPLPENVIDDAIKTLNQYYDMKTRDPESGSQNDEVKISIRGIDAFQSGEKIKAPISEMVSFPEASDLLLGEIQEQLRDLQAKMHFRYISLSSIFADEFDIITLNENGEMVYNFHFLDRIIFFALSLGMKPYLQLSFVPTIIAKKTSPAFLRHSRYRNYAPKDNKAWKDLLEAFFEHIEERYGRSEIATWLYSIWAFPSGGWDALSFDTYAEFLSFHSFTYRIVRKFLPEAKLGTPCAPLFLEENGEMITDLLKYASEDDETFSFFPFQCFAEKFYLARGQRRATYFDSEDHLAQNVKIARELLNEYGYDKNTRLLPGYGFTETQKDNMQDTCFFSAFFAKNYMENVTNLASFASISFSDFSRVSPPSKEPYCGGAGLINSEGVPKAAYAVLPLLVKMQGTLLAKGEGFCIVRNDKCIRILLYNYVKPSDLYKKGSLLLDPKDRYVAVDAAPKLHFVFELTNLPRTSCRVKNYVVSKHHGSRYDAYLALGGGDTLDMEEIEYLKKHSTPSLNVQTRLAPNRSMTVGYSLQPLEVRFVEISWSGAVDAIY